jgi:hypothetical protein
MKAVSIIWLFLFLYFCDTNSVFAQKTYEEWLELGKYEYYKTFPYNDLNEAEKAFQKAIELNPKGYEAWYRLAMTYQKKYCNQFEDVESYKKIYAQAISNCYSKTIELAPEEVNLTDFEFDPSGNYTNAWGRLALAYSIFHRNDSALWALRQMSNKYFFDVLTEMTQNMLNEVEPNAILFVNSETIYYYLLHNQLILKFRPDVKIIYFEGMNAVWYDVYLQDLYFPELHISKDEIESNQEARILENSLVFSHHQIRKSLEFPFSSNTVINRANWFFYKILQHNAFRYPVYVIASFDNEITRAMKNHWQITGLNKKLFFEIPEKPYEELLINAKKWKFEIIKSKNGNISNYLLKKLQFYRLPFIHYAYNHISQNKELVKNLIEELEKVLPESILPMQKDIKDFFLQIKQAASK